MPKPNNRKRKVDPLPPLEDRPAVGLLDPDTLYAFESNLKGAELDDWKLFKALVRRHKGNFRSCMLSFIILEELDEARGKYLQAANIDKSEKRAENIKRAGLVLQQGVHALDDAWKRVSLLRGDLRRVRGISG